MRLDRHALYCPPMMDGRGSGSGHHMSRLSPVRGCRCPDAPLAMPQEKGGRYQLQARDWRRKSARKGVPGWSGLLRLVQSPVGAVTGPGSHRLAAGEWDGDTARARQALMNSWEVSRSRRPATGRRRQWQDLVACNSFRFFSFLFFLDRPRRSTGGVRDRRGTIPTTDLIRRRGQPGPKKSIVALPAGVFRSDCIRSRNEGLSAHS